jgi:hypothetical protein
MSGLRLFVSKRDGHPIIDDTEIAAPVNPSFVRKFRRVKLLNTIPL